jgi:ABC-type microcin C transport system permease subunit YejB
VSDKLSAASLLLTAVAIIYSLWYPEISRALKIAPKPHKPDNRTDFKEVGQILITRSLPLFLISIALVAIFAPDSVQIIRLTLQTLASAELRARSRYDAVTACFLAVSSLTLLFTAHLAVLSIRLAGLRQRLNPNE